MRVIPVPNSPEWEPNVPEASLTTSDDGTATLTVRAHPDDPEQSRVVIEWSGTVSASIGQPNNEGRAAHPLYACGLDRLLWMGEVEGDVEAPARRFVLPLKEDTIDVVAREFRVRREALRPLMTVGYWANGGHHDYADPHDWVDDGWDADERFDVASYLEHQPIARAFMGYSRCRICGQQNGALELSDGVFIWPDGLVHYVRDHSVRLPPPFVRHILQQQCRWDDATSSTDWWVAECGRGAPEGRREGDGGDE